MPRNERLAALGPWLLGFLLAANAYVLPSASGSPRASDLLALLAAAWVLRRLVGGGLPGRALASLAVLAVPVAAWAGVAAASGRGATLLLALRWLAALPLGLLLADVASRDGARLRLARGLWWGLAAGVAVLGLQYAGLFDLTRSVGLAASDSVLSDLDQTWRYPGMHGHANASAAVASLLAPVSVWLYLAGAARAWLPPAGAVLLLAAGHATSTRSPLLIALGTVFALLLCARRAALVVRAGVALAALVLPLLLWLGPPGGQARWGDEGNVAINSSERLASNGVGLRLIGEHPLGVGVERAAETLEDALDNPSMHNALLQVAAVFGLPVALWLLLQMLALMARLPRGPAAPRALEAGLALQVLGLCFFEEHGNNPTLVALLAWFVAAAAGDGGARGRGDAA